MVNIQAGSVKLICFQFGLPYVFLEFSNNGMNRYIWVNVKYQNVTSFSNVWYSAPISKVYLLFGIINNSQWRGAHIFTPVKTPIGRGYSCTGILLLPILVTHARTYSCNKIHIICVGIRRLSSHKHFRRSSNTALVLSHHPARSVQR